MSFRRSDGSTDRAESERLLDAAGAGRPPAPGADPLVHLLAAAAALTNSGELSGEERAVAAFRAARANPAPARTARPRRFRVGVAAWAAGLAATATAGVAFAAASLERPEPLPAPTTAGSTGAGATGSPSRSQGDAPSAGTSGPAASPTPDRTGGPGRPATVEQLTGLCRAYLAKATDQRAKALETPAFADLVAAAGGAGRVEAYCVGLVSEGDRKTSPSSRATRSSAAGTSATPAHATGRPSTVG